jgi:hypothetical protein
VLFDLGFNVAKLCLLMLSVEDYARATGRTYEPGVEYECPNCKGVWNHVETPNFKIISEQGGIIKGTSIFYPVMPPTVLVDIMNQQPNKTEAKRIRQWTNSKRLKHKRSLL